MRMFGLVSMVVALAVDAALRQKQLEQDDK
jgi:hypothetical protein